jgi:hypothetical protein
VLDDDSNTVLHSSNREDQSLGHCDLDLHPLIEELEARTKDAEAEASRSPPNACALQDASDLVVERLLSLPLVQANGEYKGDLAVLVSVNALRRPANLVLAVRVLRPPILRARAFLLYYRTPFDQAIYDKVRDPLYFVMMAVAASSNVFVRGTFFTLYLARCVRSVPFAAQDAHKPSVQALPQLLCARAASWSIVRSSN